MEGFCRDTPGWHVQVKLPCVHGVVTLFSYYVHSYTFNNDNNGYIIIANY